MREPNTKVSGVYFPSDAPPADGWGLRIGAFSRKFRESFAKEWVEVKVHFEGSGLVSLAKKPSQQQLVLRRGFRDASLVSYDEVIRDSLVCDLAGDEWIFMIRETFFIRGEWPFAEKGF